MTTDLAPKPVGDEPGGTDTAAPAAGTVDLTALDLRPDAGAPPAPGEAEPVELLEVELPRYVGTERISTRMVVSGVAAMLVVVLAPLVVLLAAVAVPTTEQLQGGLLVAGWVALAAGARWIETRRTRPRRGIDR